MKITFGLVVYNEEKLIRRCLESIKDAADEIIVIHDGDCSDRTLDIAKEFTDKVFVRPRQLGSDPHRIYILEQARNEWVFMIDADEFLSEGLKDYLKKLSPEEGVGAYSFIWPLWDGEKSVTKTNFRACLFFKPKAWAIGLHNFSTQTVGEIKKIDLVLEHRPGQNKVSFKRFSGQLKNRLDRDAKQFLKGFEGLEKYNSELIPEDFKKWFNDYVTHPKRYAYGNFVKHFLGSLKNTWRDGYYGILVSAQAALYQYRLAVRIAELRTKDYN